MIQLYTVHCIGKRFTSKLIKFVTGGKFTHTAILFKINNELFIIEMQKKGCEVKTFENWKNQYNYTFEITFNEVNKTTLSDLLSYSSVKGYDFENFIFKQPIKAIKECILGKKAEVKADKNEDDRYICSEFVAHVYGWKNSQSFTPQNIYDKCLTEEIKIDLKDI